MTGALAAVLVALAVGLVVPARAPLVRSTRPPTAPAAVPARGVRQPAEAALVVAGLGLLAVLAPVGQLVLAAVAVAGLVVVRLRAAGRHEREAAARQQSVLEACEALVGELRAGQPLAPALAGAARVWPDLAPATVRARLGGDVPEALRALAGSPGAGSLGRVAGAWELCAVSGTGLVHALDLVLETVRSDQQARRQVRTELAATRATARMVSALPLLLLVGAQGAGARPGEFLLVSLPGQVCLLAGTGLVGAGLLWIERIAREAVEEG